MFITVEGRAKRGYGYDLYSLAQVILNSIPDVLDVINLDGGRSSNMAWRTETELDKVYFSNTERIYPYPNGNIISLLR